MIAFIIAITLGVGIFAYKEPVQPKKTVHEYYVEGAANKGNK